MLVTDMVLPKKSGLEVATEVGGDHPEMAVVYLSAHPTETLIEEGRLPMGTRTLEKPCRTMLP